MWPSGFSAGLDTSSFTKCKIDEHHHTPRSHAQMGKKRYRLWKTFKLSGLVWIATLAIPRQSLTLQLQQDLILPIWGYFSCSQPSDCLIAASQHRLSQEDKEKPCSWCWCKCLCSSTFILAHFNCLLHGGLEEAEQQSKPDSAATTHGKTLAWASASYPNTTYSSVPTSHLSSRRRVSKKSIDKVTRIQNYFNSSSILLAGGLLRSCVIKKLPALTNTKMTG